MCVSDLAVLCPGGGLLGVESERGRKDPGLASAGKNRKSVWDAKTEIALCPHPDERQGEGTYGSQPDDDLLQSQEAADDFRSGGLAIEAAEPIA